MSPRKLNEEQIYNIYFQSCARGGHDIAKASPYTYECSYEYGESNRYPDGTAKTIVYKGDLTFDLNSRTLSGRTSFSIDVRQQNGLTTATYSEEAEWTGKRQDDREDCATTQETVETFLQSVS